MFAVGDTFGKEGGFSESSWSRDDSQFSIQALLKFSYKMRAWDEIGWRTRNINFGGKDWSRHQCNPFLDKEHYITRMTVCSTIILS